MKIAGSALLTFLLFLFSFTAQAALIAEVDRSRVSVDDGVTLTLKATDDEDVEAVDLSVLEVDFVVGRASRNTQLSIVNGRRELVSELIVPLYPRHTGALTIPALTVNGRVSQAINLQVVEGATALDSDTEVFVEVDVDREKSYVQAQVIYRFTLYRAVQLDDLRLTPLEHPNAIVQELDTQSFQRSKDGRTFLVTQISYAVFPQKSGKMILPALTFTARERSARQNFMSLGKQGKPIRRRTQQIMLDVRPIPSAFPDSPWLPAASLDIDEDWSISPDLLKLGESSTRTLTIAANGLAGNQLPGIKLESPDGIKIYPDQPQSENVTKPSGITGLGITSAALLVTAAGDYLLPTIRIPWWDTEADELRYAEVPAWKFSIAEAALPQVNPSVVTDQATGPAQYPDVGGPISAQKSLWFWTTMAVLLGWLLTLAWFWRRRGAPAARLSADTEQQEKESAVFKMFIAACNKNQARDSRRALQKWAQLYFASEHLLSIEELCKLCDRPGLLELLMELEQSLYSSAGGSWQGNKLGGALKAWRKQSKTDKRSKPDALPPLYN